MRSNLNLSIRTRLLASFGVVVALMLAVGGLAITRLGSENAHVTKLASRIVPATDLVGQASALMNKYRKDELHYILATPTDRAGAQGVSGDLAGDLQSMTALLDQYRSQGLIADATDARLMARFRTDFDTYVAKTAAFRSLADSGQIAAAGNVVGTGPGDAAYNDLKTADTNWESYKQTLATRAAAASKSAYGSSRTVIIALLIVAVLLALGIALWFSRRLSRGLNAVNRAAVKIARGEIDQHVEVVTNDELGAMATEFNAMIQYLRETTTVAETIARGDLSVQLIPRSRADVLGNALADMTDGLRDFIGSINQATSMMNTSTRQIAGTSETAGRSVNEVSTAINDVAHGNERQVQSIDEARRVAEQVAAAAESGAAIAQQTAEAVD
ncbi:MAG: methyl-accepting chemotaxis protein, partial [Solirubrobacteraceae bacterium]